MAKLVSGGSLVHPHKWLRAPIWFTEPLFFSVSLIFRLVVLGVLADPARIPKGLASLLLPLWAKGYQP